MMNASRGYFYVNVQSVTPNNTYLLKTTAYPASNSIRLVNWRLNSINLDYTHLEDSLYVFAQPARCLSSSCPTTTQLTFHLYITANCSNIMSYSRCSINETADKILMYRMVVSPHFIPENITFKIPTKLLPEVFSMAAKVEALETEAGVNRSVPYFYNTSMNLNKVDVLRKGGAGNNCVT